MRNQMLDDPPETPFFLKTLEEKKIPNQNQTKTQNLNQIIKA